MSFKLKTIQLTNFGPIHEISCSTLSNINLVIGEKGSGKTTLLKSLYTAIHAVEKSENVSEKLQQLFEVPHLVDLQGNSETPLYFKATSASNEFCLEYDILRTCGFVLQKAIVPQKAKNGEAVFIPAHEIVSCYNLLLQSREMKFPIHTGDTYHDLLDAIQQPIITKLNPVFASVKQQVESLSDENILFVPSTNRWSCASKDGNKMPLGLASSSTKKMATLIHLIKNGTINQDSVLFFDGLEDTLHPDTICDLLEILFVLTQKTNIQIFISSCSYFVIKKLALLASTPGMVNCISLKRGEAAQTFDLNEGMPDNSIIQKSIDLYREEVEQKLR